MRTILVPFWYHDRSVDQEHSARASPPAEKKRQAKPSQLEPRSDLSHGARTSCHSATNSRGSRTDPQSSAQTAPAHERRLADHRRDHRRQERRPSMIVADTSVLVPFFIPGDRTEQVQKVMRKDSDWIAPRLWRSEFRNVLATQMRVSGLALKMAVQAMTEAEDLLREREFEPSSETVLYLANLSGTTAYDCEFIALAQLFDIPLLTHDQKLISAFPETALAVASWLAS